MLTQKKGRCVSVRVVWVWAMSERARRVCVNDVCVSDV
jgi:hypothetical protein